MKTLYKLILFTVALSMPMTGCDTDALHDLNANPQAVDKIDMAFLFTAAQLSSAGGGAAGDNRFIDWRINIGVASHAIQHLANAGNGIAPGDKYFNEETGSAWDFLTSDIGKNLQEILKQTGSGGFMEGRHNNLRQATRILRAFNFQRLTDWHGDIPYREAFKGMDGTYFPTYDTQEFIYTDLLNELSEATAAITTLAGSGDDLTFKRADLFFGNHADPAAQWKKFGYSLMLRMAMRIYEVAPTVAAPYVQKALTGGVMTSNTDNILVAMDAGGALFTNRNGISRAFRSDDGNQLSWLSETLVTRLQARNDPRLMIFSGGTGASRSMDPAAQKGLRNGLDATTVKDAFGANVNLNTDFAIINPRLLDLNDPYMLMSASESHFLLAEAAERGIISGSAATHYNNGVREALKMYTAFDGSFAVTDAQVNAYLAQPGVAYTAGATGRAQIAHEMWVSKFLNWWEAWSDWRRTGLPVLTPVNYNGQLGTPNSPGRIPVKLRIPNSEVNNNSKNFQEGATLPNEISTKVWWDVVD